MPKIQNFTILLTTFLETLARTVHEFWGANLLCSFRGDALRYICPHIVPCQLTKANIKRPMRLDALLKNQLRHGPKFQKLHTLCALCYRHTGRFSKFSYLGRNYKSCTHTLFLPQRVEIEPILALRAAVSDIRANFQNCHIWA